MKSESEDIEEETEGNIYVMKQQPLELQEETQESRSQRAAQGAYRMKSEDEAARTRRDGTRTK